MWSLKRIAGRGGRLLVAALVAVAAIGLLPAALRPDRLRRAAADASSRRSTCSRCGPRSTRSASAHYLRSELVFDLDGSRRAGAEALQARDHRPRHRASADRRHRDRPGLSGTLNVDAEYTLTNWDGSQNIAGGTATALGELRPLGPALRRRARRARRGDPGREAARRADQDAARGGARLEVLSARSGMTAVKAGDVDGALQAPRPAQTVAFCSTAPTRASSPSGRRRRPSARSTIPPIRSSSSGSTATRVASRSGPPRRRGRHDRPVRRARARSGSKPTSRNLAPAVAPVLEMPLQDTLVVIEAGDLAEIVASAHAVRALAEGAGHALLRRRRRGARHGGRRGAAGRRPRRSPATRATRCSRASAATALATRSEIAKLALYVHGRREVTLDDVDAVMSDVSSLAIDAVVDAAFAGDRARLDRAHRRLAAEGARPRSSSARALRHAIALLSAREDIDAGRSVDEAWRSFRLHSGARPRSSSSSSAGPRRAARRCRELQAAVLESRRRAEVAQAVAGACASRISQGRARADGGAVERLRRNRHRPMSRVRDRIPSASPVTRSAPAARPYLSPAASPSGAGTGRRADRACRSGCGARRPCRGARSRP